jgi:anti-sigma-K factor RskA
MAPLEDDIEDMDEVLAAEHVAGLTSAAERAAVRDRLRSDFAFAGLVDKWEAELYGLGEDVREVKPPSAAWKEVERRAFGLTPEKETRLQRALNFWRRLSFGAIGIVAGAVAVFQPAETPLFQLDPYIATLRPVGADTVIVAWLHSGSGELHIEPVPVQDGDKNVRVWLLHATWEPQPIGTLAETGTTRIPLPAQLRPLPANGLRVGLTLEESTAGGAPQPPDEFYAVGDLRQI